MVEGICMMATKMSCEETSREPSVKVVFQLPGAFCRSPIIRCSGGRINGRGKDGGGGRCERPQIKRAVREWRTEIAQKAHTKKRKTEEAIAKSVSERERVSECSVDSGGDDKSENSREKVGDSIGVYGGGGSGDIMKNKRERVSSCGVDGDMDDDDIADVDESDSISTDNVGSGGDDDSGCKFNLSAPSTTQHSNINTAEQITAPDLFQLATSQNSSQFSIPPLNTAPNLSQLTTAQKSSQFSIPPLNTAPNLSQLTTAQNSNQFSITPLNTAQHSTPSTAPNLSQLATAQNSNQFSISPLNTAPNLSQLTTAQNSSQFSIPPLNTVPNLFQLTTVQNSNQFSIPPLNTAPNLSQLSTAQNTSQFSIPPLNTAANLSQLTTAQNNNQFSIPSLNTAQHSIPRIAPNLSQLASAQNSSQFTSPLNTAKNSTDFGLFQLATTQPTKDINTHTDQSLSSITNTQLNITTNSTASPITTTTTTTTITTSSFTSSFAPPLPTLSDTPTSASPSLSSLAALHLSATNPVSPNTNVQTNISGPPPLSLSIPPLTIPHSQTPTNTAVPSLAFSIPPLNLPHTQTNAHTNTPVPPFALSIPPLTILQTQRDVKEEEEEEEEEGEGELEDLLEGMEWNVNAEIDLKTALLPEKTKKLETTEPDTNDYQFLPPPPVIECTHIHTHAQIDTTLLKDMPSPFGAVVAEFVPGRATERSPAEYVIQVPFSIFQFDTPSPDEVVKMAKNDLSNPSRYKLITVDRMTKR